MVGIIIMVFLVILSISLFAAGAYAFGVALAVIPIGMLIVIVYLNQEEKKKKQEEKDKLNKMSAAEKEKYYLEKELSNYSYSIRKCESCKKELIYIQGNKIRTDWVLVAKDVQNRMETYKCPHCGFVRTE